MSNIFLVEILPTQTFSTITNLKHFIPSEIALNASFWIETSRKGTVSQDWFSPALFPQGSVSERHPHLGHLAHLKKHIPCTI